MIPAVAVVFVIIVAVISNCDCLTNAEVVKTNELVLHELKRSTCDLNDNYWNLIRWFFERVKFIEVTEITQNRHQYSKFANNIIIELGLSKSI